MTERFGLCVSQWLWRLLANAMCDDYNCQMTFQSFCGWASSFPQLFGFLGSGLIGAYVTKSRKYITTCKVVYAIGAITTIIMGLVRRVTVYFQIVWIPTRKIYMYSSLPLKLVSTLLT